MSKKLRLRNLVARYALFSLSDMTRINYLALHVRPPMLHQQQLSKHKMIVITSNGGCFHLLDLPLARTRESVESIPQ